MPVTPPPTPPLVASRPLRLAIIGAGPVGLALALEAAKALPSAHIAVFDARPADRDVSGDPRTLALSLGSVQTLTRLGLWPAISAGSGAASILKVHVSQQQPTVWWPGSEQPAVSITAAEQKVDRLGAVLSHGTLVAPMQAAWLRAVEAEPQRLSMRFSSPVKGLKPVDQSPDGSAGRGVEVDATVAEVFDMAVVAEGGVFADQPALRWPRGLSHDYGQTAWVGQVLLSDDSPVGVAYERFTPSGPAALLPLPDGPLLGGGASGRRAALVWCVNAADDPLASLDDAQRLQVLNDLMPPQVGALRALSPLKAFALGLNAHTRLVSDGVVARIGNAAQTLHPVAGQGLNLGLRDVHDMLQALKGCERVGESGDVAAALAAFERRRQPDRLALVAATHFLARSFTFPAPILATVRGMGLGLLQALSPVKTGLATLLMFGHR